MSVSRKFSQKFHDFFQTVIIKGQVLGSVSHYFFKNEYQACGAPHYDILLMLLWPEQATTMRYCSGFRPESPVVSPRRTVIPTAPVGHEISAPQVQQLLSKKKTGWGYFHHAMQVRIPTTGVFNSHSVVCGRMHEIVPQKNVHPSSVTRGN